MNDSSSEKIDGGTSVSNLPNDGVGHSDSLIEPLPAYEVQYYSYQQRQERHQDQQPNCDAPGEPIAIQPQNERLQVSDTYQPLPINPSEARIQAQMSSQPEEAFPFDESRDQNEGAPLFYFDRDAQLVQRSLRPLTQGDNLDTSTQGHFSYRRSEQHGGHICRQQQDFCGFRRKQESLIEPFPLEIQIPPPQPQQQQLFDQTIENKPWPPKQSLPPAPQPEPTTWWDSYNVDESDPFQGNESRHVVLAGGVENVQQVEQPVTQQPGIILPMHQRKELRPQQPAFGRPPPPQANQPVQLLGVIGKGAGMQFLEAASQPLQSFQHPFFFPPAQPHFPTNACVTRSTVTSTAPQLDQNSLAVTFPQLPPEQRTKNTATMSMKAAPKVTMDMLRKSRKTPKEPDTSTANYVLRVHDMLEDAQADNFSDVISWQSHGRAFKIHQPEKFYREILPKYFHCKQTSFLRWLRDILCEG
jgi:hypothetical protein